MTWAEYHPATEALSFGKRLPTAIYIHRDGVPNMPPALQEVVLRSVDALKISDEFNLLKFHTVAFKLTFLSYPTFWEDPHPALHKVITVDLVSGRARQQTFGSRANPPILHRKETFLAPGHARSLEFTTLQLGLNFAEAGRELFGGAEMGEDALRVLQDYRQLHRRIAKEIDAELPQVRAAASWAKGRRKTSGAKTQRPIPRSP